MVDVHEKILCFNFEGSPNLPLAFSRTCLQNQGENITVVTAANTIVSTRAARGKTGVSRNRSPVRVSGRVPPAPLRPGCQVVPTLTLSGR